MVVGRFFRRVSRLWQRASMLGRLLGRQQHRRATAARVLLDAGGVRLVAIEGSPGLIVCRAAGAAAAAAPVRVVAPRPRADSAAAVRLLAGCRRPLAVRPRDFGLPYALLQHGETGPKRYYGPMDDVSPSLTD